MASSSDTGSPREVVITGLGVVSPIGIGRRCISGFLRDGVSGVRPITLFDASGFPVRIGAEVVDFDPKAYIRPRKSLKVMSREIQFGFAAADMALANRLYPTRPDRARSVRRRVRFGNDLLRFGRVGKRLSPLPGRWHF